MSFEPQAMHDDPRLAIAHDLMKQALMLLDEAACHRPAALLDYAIHALADVQPVVGIAASFIGSA